jgi:putative addiction module killer protein
MAYELEQTALFENWLKSLDADNRRRIVSRLARVELGNFGDHKQIAEALFELRCFFGGGIRMYYTVRRNALVFMLAGGGKDSQTNDIETAKDLLRTLEDESWP